MVLGKAAMIARAVPAQAFHRGLRRGNSTAITLLAEPHLRNLDNSRNVVELRQQDRLGIIRGTGILPVFERPITGKMPVPRKTLPKHCLC